MTSEQETILDVTEKFKTVLNALLQQNYSVMNDVYLDMFITHVSGKHGEDYSSLLSDPFTLTWIESSVSKIISEHTKSIHGFAFTCQLLALLTENEESFRQINQRKIYHNIQTALSDHVSDLQNPSSKLALITLYQSMLSHSDGVEWLKETHAWKQAIGYCIEDQTIYVVRKSTEFLTDFLFQIATDDDKLCLEIINEISRPLSENVYIEEIGKVCVDSCDLQRKVTPTIDILCHILERYFHSNIKSGISNHIIKTSKGQYNLWKLTDMTHDRKLYEKISKCLVYMSFTALIDTLNKNGEKDTSPNSVNEYTEFGLTFLNSCRWCILKNQHEALLIIARIYYVLWKSMGDRAPEEIILGNQLTKFENQVILFQILPLINVMYRPENYNNEIHDEYVMKLFHISTEHTLRICYSFRDSLINGNLDLYDMASKAVQGILSMVHVLHRDRAVIVFQALCHIIKGVAFPRDSKDLISLVERPTFMSSVLTGLYTIVKKYSITWRDSFESIALLNFMLYAMEDPNLTPRLAVEVLKLAQLSVEHFLAPNLALLVDTLAGSDMQKLGPMILKRLHDFNWEVRDSTLELLASMANISFSKFPAFQEHIASNGLCPLVVEIAKNDAEYYVRASALNCISQMVPVNLFWEQCFSTQNLVEFLLHVIQTEYEGIVRKEAVSLITCIYENQRVPSNQLETTYQTLAYAAVHDLFWEVKVKAIDFWHSVIQRQLQYQGVIDGTFPSVTFSKEKKKIITLTQKEITLRLTKVLDTLSKCGCLGVLLASLDDEDDIVVIESGVKAIHSFTEFLNKYNYWEELGNIPHDEPMKPSTSSVNEPDTSAESNKMETETPPPATGISTEEYMHSDEVIQSIVLSKDISLLTKAYENQMNMDATNAHSNNSASDQTECSKSFKIVRPQIFMDKVKTTDLNGLIKTRTEWLSHTESFSSLLNDMLYSLNAHESHDADCY